MMNDHDLPVELPEPVPAEVLQVRRAFDPIRMDLTTHITFCLGLEEDVTLPVTGEGGRHVFPGDRGMLAYHGSILVSFEKESGEVIGGMYYIPAEEENADE